MPSECCTLAPLSSPISRSRHRRLDIHPISRSRHRRLDIHTNIEAGHVVALYFRALVSLACSLFFFILTCFVAVCAGIFSVRLKSAVKLVEKVLVGVNQHVYNYTRDTAKCTEHVSRGIPKSASKKSSPAFPRLHGSRISRKLEVRCAFYLTRARALLSTTSFLSRARAATAAAAAD